jgi:hypothetical protein
MNYQDPNWKRRHKTPQCVGHAVMRNKCGVASMMPAQLLAMSPREGDNVFESLAHFYSHHTGMTLEAAQARLNTPFVAACVSHEFLRSGAGVINKNEVPVPKE